ncbi:MAG: N-formylglutamate amidohydrolase [Cyclobacteriaceae bacterium]|nr:N-formylglutamate amidohydrolase [Cyclobacteriaceae bacterium]
MMVISCEHASNAVPEEYRFLFAGHEAVLQSHRGWDPGAADLAAHMHQTLGVPLFVTAFTRLLVEANRSIDSNELFSEFSKGLSVQEKEDVLRQFYFPYRTQVEEALLKQPKPVLHLSIHSFTPVLMDLVRELEIGLLFDPEREMERIFCEKLQRELLQRLPELRILFNEPYKGTDDGLVTAMRKKFPGNEYLGIEVEVNQKLIGTSLEAELTKALTESIRCLVQ